MNKVAYKYGFKLGIQKAAGVKDFIADSPWLSTIGGGLAGIGLGAGAGALTTGNVDPMMTLGLAGGTAGGLITSLLLKRNREKERELARRVHTNRYPLFPMYRS